MRDTFEVERREINRSYRKSVEWKAFCAAQQLAAHLSDILDTWIKDELGIAKPEAKPEIATAV